MQSNDKNKMVIVGEQMPAEMSSAADLENEIENCELIEFPSKNQAQENNNANRHDIRDCPGFCKIDGILRKPNVDIIEGGAGAEGESGNEQKIVDEIVKQVGSQKAFTDAVFGRLIPVGHIGLYDHNGKVKAVPQGRWRLPMLSRTDWSKVPQSVRGRNVGAGGDDGGACVVSLNQSTIAFKTLLIVRVPKGQIGLVQDNGNPLLLDEGTHIFNRGVTSFEKFEKKDESYICHGENLMHILRVPRGKFAKVWVPSPDRETENATGGSASIEPRLLSEGMHCIVNPYFRFKPQVFVDCSEVYIQHGSVHLFSIPKGSVAKVFHDNKPRLLGEGNHVIESVNFKYHGMASLMDKVIQHGTMSIVRVPLGELGICWLKNQPHFIDRAGLYAFNTPDFSFVRHVPSNERVIELGAKKIIMVYTGEVGISYENGELRIMDHGRHIIDDATISFESFLSTQQKSIRLVTETFEQRMQKMKAKDAKLSQNSSSTRAREQAEYGYSNSAAGASTTASTTQRTLSDREKQHKADEKADLMQCETKDLVKVGVRADVFYSIADPKKAIQRIRADEIEDLVRETAIATLTNIIRSTALNEIAQSKLPSAVSEAAGSAAVQLLEQQALMTTGNGAKVASAPLFFDKAHDEFLSKLHDDFLQRYGLDIANIRIESFKIMDDELAESISKQALVTAQTENELANLQGKTEIATAEQHRIAEVQNIAAEAEARSLKIKTDAENERRVEQAKAAAEADKVRVKLQSEAAAEAEITQAKAHAESIRMVAEAEAMRAEMLSRTALGQQQSLLQIYADMIGKTSQGIEKVVYCDPSLQQAGSALSLPALANLNRDLHMLGGIVGEGQMQGGGATGGASASIHSMNSSAGAIGGTGGPGDSFMTNTSGAAKPSPMSTNGASTNVTPARA